MIGPLLKKKKIMIGANYKRWRRDGKLFNKINKYKCVIENLSTKSKIC